jgi:PAS domain S-box-containing protein
VSHLDNSPLAVIEWDEAFRVRRWSRGAEALFGWQAAEVLGRRPDEWPFVHADDLAAVVLVMSDLLERRAPRNVCRNRNCTKLGDVRICDWYNSVQHDDERRVASILSLVDDVTERLELDARTQRSQRLESVGQLTGGIAHDFNNLLTVIGGNADVLTERLVDDPHGARLAGMITEAANRGAELTRALLAFARQQPLEPRVTDVATLVADFEPLLRRAVGEAVEVSVDAAPLPWTTEIDPHQLESSLLNLVLNARDAMPQGGRLTIDVDTAHVDEAAAARRGDVAAGDYVVVAVSDTGRGIARDELERVFEPFYTTKRAGTGHGLGLSMVHGFIEQSRGHVSVDSEPGQGTTMRLYLPRYLGAESSANGGATHVRPSAATGTQAPLADVGDAEPGR